METLLFLGFLLDKCLRDMSCGDFTCLVARQMQTADSLASNVSRARMSQLTVAEIMLARCEEHITRNTLHWNLYAVVGNEATCNCAIPLILR